MPQAEINLDRRALSGRGQGRLREPRPPRRRQPLLPVHPDPGLEPAHLGRHLGREDLLPGSLRLRKERLKRDTNWAARAAGPDQRCATGHCIESSTGQESNGWGSTPGRVTPFTATTSGSNRPPARGRTPPG